MTIGPAPMIRILWMSVRLGTAVLPDDLGRRVYRAAHQPPFGDAGGGWRGPQNFTILARIHAGRQGRRRPRRVRARRRKLALAIRPRQDGGQAGDGTPRGRKSPTSPGSAATDPDREGYPCSTT